MLVKEWNKLPDEMRNTKVGAYYLILRRKWFSLLLKRLFDITVSFIMLLLLSPLFLVLALAIKIDSRGPVFYRQVRVTQYGKRFRIHKFRSMVNNADKLGSEVTVNNDSRVTKVGRFIRKFRLDEISQLIDVLIGNMTFVGTRPEVPKYVEQYTPEMMATLLLPAGITSEASINYKDEAKLLDNAENAEEVYVNEVLPAKMKYNLHSLYKQSIFGDLATMFKTVVAVLKR